MVTEIEIGVRLEFAKLRLGLESKVSNEIPGQNLARGVLAPLVEVGEMSYGNLVKG
jgi:hypothetical protein